MRRMGILLAGAALVLLPAGPGAGTAAAQEPTGQTVSPMGHHRHDRHGHHGHGHHRHGHHGHGHHRHYDGGYCYGCDGQGSYCDASGCYYRHPYYGGGYGCNYDYPCGPPYRD